MKPQLARRLDGQMPPFHKSSSIKDLNNLNLEPTDKDRVSTSAVALTSSGLEVAVILSAGESSEGTSGRVHTQYIHHLRGVQPLPSP